MQRNCTVSDPDSSSELTGRYPPSRTTARPATSVSACGPGAGRERAWRRAHAAQRSCAHHTCRTSRIPLASPQEPVRTYSARGQRTTNEHATDIAKRLKSPQASSLHWSSASTLVRVYGYWLANSSQPRATYLRADTLDAAGLNIV